MYTEKTSAREACRTATDLPCRHLSIQFSVIYEYQNAFMRIILYSNKSDAECPIDLSRMDVGMPEYVYLPT